MKKLKLKWKMPLLIVAMSSCAFSPFLNAQFKENELRTLLIQLDLRADEQIIAGQTEKLSSAFRNNFRTPRQLTRENVNLYFERRPQEVMAFREYVQRLVNMQIITTAQGEALVRDSLVALENASIRPKPPGIGRRQESASLLSGAAVSFPLDMTSNTSQGTSIGNDDINQLGNKTLDFGESLEQEQKASLAAQKLQDTLLEQERIERNKQLAQALIKEFSNGKPSAQSIGKRVERAVSSFVEQESRERGERIFDNVEVSVESIAGNPEYSIRGLMAFDDVNPDYFSFSELGVTADGDDSTINIGIGIRKLSKSQTMMAGINAFYDQELGSGHKRGSVGAEFVSKPLRANANRYFSLSNGINRNTAQAEKPISGHDFDVEVSLPYFPGLVAGYNQSKWYGEDGVSDVERKAYRLSGNLSPNVNLELSNRTYDSGAKDQNTAKISYMYRFGSEGEVPTLIEMDSVAYRSAKLAPHERYKFVERENRIITQVANTSNLTMTFTGL